MNSNQSPLSYFNAINRKELEVAVEDRLFDATSSEERMEINSMYNLAKEALRKVSNSVNFIDDETLKKFKDRFTWEAMYVIRESLIEYPNMDSTKSSKVFYDVPKECHIADEDGIYLRSSSIEEERVCKRNKLGDSLNFRVNKHFRLVSNYQIEEEGLYVIKDNSIDTVLISTVR